jgi:hypothetical protein
VLSLLVAFQAAAQTQTPNRDWNRLGQLLAPSDRVVVTLRTHEDIDGEFVAVDDVRITVRTPEGLRQAARDGVSEVVAFEYSENPPRS